MRKHKRIGCMVRGFTLLELLVVIGIISILVAMGAVSYSAAQKSGRDSRRKQDMVSMQSAIEEYYGSNSFMYPVACDDASTYLKSAWPKDPVNGTIGSIEYVYSEVCDTDGFVLCAPLENFNGNSVTVQIDPDSIVWEDDGKLAQYYCVSNLQ